MAQSLAIRGTGLSSTHEGPTIHRLPNEILVYIYIHYNDSIASDRRMREYRVKPRQRHACHWIPLMLVCRRWRELGTATPGLWQAIDVERNTKWLPLALDRSQGMPLEIHFHSSPTALSSIPLLTPHTHRLRTLLLPEVKRADAHALHELLSKDMPILNELGVWAVKDDRVTQLGGTGPVASFRPEHFPNLRVLRLSFTGIPWEPSTVSHLRYLNLYGCHSLDPTLPFERFLDVLVDCPELEELRLHRFISTISHRVPAGFERNISLPRLRKLVVGDQPPLVGLLLSSVSLPPKITLRITGWIDNPFDDDASRLMRSMLPEDRGKIPILQSATRIEFDGYGWLSIRATSQDASIALRLRAGYHMDEIGTYTWRALKELTHIFGSASVEELQIACLADSVDDSEVWEDILASFPGLRDLQVLPGQMVRPIWHALGGRSFPLLEDHRDALCPNLRVLDMQYLRWDIDAMDYIMASLRRRAMRGLPRLTSLYLGFFTDNDEEADNEVGHMLPFYAGHLDSYTAAFDWGCE